MQGARAMFHPREAVLRENWPSFGFIWCGRIGEGLRMLIASGRQVLCYIMQRTYAILVGRVNIGLMIQSSLAKPQG